MLVVESIVPAIAGMGLGLVPAFWLSKLLEPILYRVSALEPIAFCTGVCALTSAAVLAAWLPARRAARVDPSTLLREL